MSDTRDNSQGPSVNSISAVRISVASPEQIRSWSCGEVTEAKDLDRVSEKPHVGGIFCERIFGPVKNFRCSCGKYNGREHKGVICDKCGVKVTRSLVRRERMGHIELACPVSHAWFVEATPSPLALLLDISRAELRRIIYCHDLVVTEGNEKARQRALRRLREERKQELAATERESPPEEVVERLEAISAQFDEQVRHLRRLRDPILGNRLRVLAEAEYRTLSERYAGIFCAETGAEAILKILKRLDLNTLYGRLTDQLGGRRHKKAIRLLRIVKPLRRSGNRPEWMILTVLPVLPPDLRPLIRLDDGRFVTSDLNERYLQIIRRNNRLKRLVEEQAREAELLEGKRMLQEAVDGLIGGVENTQRNRSG
jgi:DNA-directed RNA polymerase subunit beta'